MSMHKIPLTPIEEAGLRSHGLPIGTPSQLSDVFRSGIAWHQKATLQEVADSGQAMGHNWECAIPGLYDSAYCCTKCGKQVVERAEDAGSAMKEAGPCQFTATTPAESDAIHIPPITKEWCMNMAKREEGVEDFAAGVPAKEPAKDCKLGCEHGVCLADIHGCPSECVKSRSVKEPAQDERNANAILTALLWMYRRLKPACGPLTGIEEAIAAATALAQVPGWMPISSAPEEGEFLVNMPNERAKIQVAKWHKNVKVIGNAFDFDLTKPTHWMPLPPPPAQEEK